MKTLAQFKRDIEPGVSILCLEIQQTRGDTPLAVVPIKERMQGLRLVTYKDTTGFYLKSPKDETDKRARGSFCGFPKAPELEYNGDLFTITERDRDGNVWQVRKYKIFK